MAMDVREDEILLEDILSFFRGSWQLILGFCAAGALTAAALAWSLPQKYELSVKLLAPLEGQLAAVNLGRIPMSGLEVVQPQDIFSLFTDRLASNEFKTEFFQKTYLPSLPTLPATEKARIALMNHVLKKDIEVIAPSSKGKDFYQLRMQASTSEDVVARLKAYLVQAEESALNLWQQDRRAVLEVAIHNTTQELVEREAHSKRLSEDRVVRLSEALEVASAVGVDSPQVTTARLSAQESLTSFADGSRMYARGVKSLQAELDVLRKRELERPFMDGVREVEARLELLKEHGRKTQVFPMYRLDGEILSPVEPVSPNKSLILLMGLFVGGFLGCLLALWKLKIKSQSTGHVKDQLTSGVNA